MFLRYKHAVCFHKTLWFENIFRYELSVVKVQIVKKSGF